MNAMQPYRIARLHDAADCEHCERRGRSHRLCQFPGCDEPAEIQYQRHATLDEYEDLPEEFRPIDGVAHQSVFVCGDHEPDPVCDDTEHTPAPNAEPTPCPTCPAGADEPCQRADRKPRTLPHPARAQATATPHASACTHVHREDCGGQGACPCTAGDLAPDRPKRIVPPPPEPGMEPIRVPVDGEGAELLAARGVDMARCMGITLIPTSHDTAILRARLAVLDATGNFQFTPHGTQETEDVDVEVELRTPSTPVG